MSESNEPSGCQDPPTTLRGIIGRVGQALSIIQSSLIFPSRLAVGMQNTMS